MKRNKLKVLDHRVEGDWVHIQFDTSESDQEAFGPCLCCGSTTLESHAAVHFCTVPATIDDIDLEVWKFVRANNFVEAKKVNAPGCTDIVDHCFHVVSCPQGGHYLVQSLFDRSTDTKVIAREIVDSQITNYVHIFRKLNSSWMVSPKDQAYHFLK